MTIRKDFASGRGGPWLSALIRFELAALALLARLSARIIRDEPVTPRSRERRRMESRPLEPTLVFRRIYKIPICLQIRFSARHEKDQGLPLRLPR